MTILKKHWGTILGVAGPLLAFLQPSIHMYAQTHPHETIGVIAAALVTLYNARAPKDKTGAPRVQ